MKRVTLFADATCDLPGELVEKYDVRLVPGTVILDGKDYIDNVTITPDEMYRIYREKKILPKSAATNTDTYLNMFAPELDAGNEVIVVNMSSGISASHQAAAAAADMRNGIYAIDSKSLSTGVGQLVIEAGELIKQGLPAKEVAESVNRLVPKVKTSFVLDTLEFMRAGGRCSAVAAIGANLLGLKPCIEMDSNGVLQATKKYRGSLEKVLPLYVNDQLTSGKNVRTDKIFITYSSGIPDILDIVIASIKKFAEFDNIYWSQASCVISTHCGPGTFGILFMTE